MRTALAVSLVLAVFLGAQVASAAPPRIAALDFNVIGVDKSMGSFYAEHLSVRLEGHGVRVTTQRDIAAVLSIERQKQLLGCADDSTSCMAELAGALGVDALATGQMARVGKSFQVNLRILSARDASALFVFSKLVKTEEALLEALNEAADQAAPKLRPGAPVAANVEPQSPAEPTLPEVKQPAPSRPFKPGLWALLGAGTAAMVTGGGLLALNAGTWGDLKGVPKLELPPSQAEEQANVASTRQTIGIACLAVGAAAIAGGVTWYLLSRNDLQVGMAPTGPGVLVRVRW